MSGILGVDNALFDVGDLERARAHYARLGLCERFAVPGLVMYALGDERPGLLLRAVDALPESTALGPHVWLEVADSARWAADHELDEPVRDTRTGRVVEIADPWGNTLGFTDYVFQPSLARPAG